MQSTSMKKIPASYGNAIILAAAVITAVFSLWSGPYNRHVNNTVGLSTLEQAQSALLLFLLTLAIVYVTPFVLSLFIRDDTPHKRWPVPEFFTVAAGVLTVALLKFWFDEYFAPLRTADSFQWKYDLYWQVKDIAESVRYATFVIAYSFIVRRLIACIREKHVAGIIINTTGILLTAFAILASNWITVYFE